MSIRTCAAKMRAEFRRFAVLPFALFCACAPRTAATAGVTIGSAAPAPHPFLAAPNDPPRIVYANVSSANVHRAQYWSGHIVTGTNVASVVVSMPFFSFEVPRTAFGDFAFKTRVDDVPALYRQRLYGAIIAYNTAGQQVSVPLAVSFR